MQKILTLFSILVCVTYIAACGSGSSTNTTHIDDLSTAIAVKPVPPTILGGAKQGTPLLLNNTVTTFAGSSAGFVNHSTATSPSAQFNHPIALTTDGSSLYVADYSNNAIRKIEIASGFVTTIDTKDADDSSVTFNLPTGITTDGTNLYVIDYGNYTIRKIALSTGVVTTLAGGDGLVGSVDADVGTDARFNVLNGITTDGISLYVTDSNNTIRRIVIESGKVTTLAGSPGAAGSADGKQDKARFNLPGRITTDGPNLYVTDFYNRTIRKIELSTGEVTTIAGIIGPLGSDEGTADGIGSEAHFYQPNGITTDGTYLYVTDSYKNTIRKIEIATNNVTTISGIKGTAGHVDSADGTPSFDTPIGITTDGTALYIADSQNNSIRRIE